MKDSSTDRALVLGWSLLAVFLPLGMTLEALHALKVPVYVGSAMRREMWTLAHAHGTFLGILCLVFAALADRAISDAAARRAISISLCIGSVMMPVGFFLAGILSGEGDPSLGILLVPIGGLFLFYALVRAALSSRNAQD